MRHSRRLVGEAMLVVATLIWGGTFAATRGGLAYISPVLLIALRFGVSFLLLAPVVALAGVRWWQRPLPGLILGLALAGAYLLQTTGLLHTTAARSAFITYLFAIFIPPLQWLVTRRRLSAGNVIGLAIVVVGVGLLTAPGAATDWRGDLITFGSAFCFAVYVVLLDRFSRDRDPTALLPTQFGTAAAIALVPLAFGAPSTFIPAPALWIALAYLTLLGTAGALGIQTLFQFRTTPIRATTIYALEPLFASLIGLVVLGEWMSAIEIAGALVIVCGVLVSELWEVVSARYRSGSP